jgi:outer membrane lipoprotein-sorting protein
MKHIQIISIWLAISLMALSSTLCASEEDKILAEIEKNLKAIKTLKVDFEQEVSSGVFATIDKSSGKIYMTSGDRFRIETDEQIIVSDSVLLWVYAIENKQVRIDSVHKIDELVRPSEYLFNFKEGYNADLLEERKCDFGDCYQVLLKATSKDEFIGEMKLFIDPKTSLTQRAEYKDINGNLVTIRFKKYNIDKNIPPDIFNFKTPKGVEEIRLP